MRAKDFIIKESIGNLDKAYIEQQLANKDINAKVEDGVVHVHPSNVRAAKSLLARLGYKQTVQGSLSEGIDDAAKDADYNTGHKKGVADARAGKKSNSKECISAQERKGYVDGYKSLNEGWGAEPANARHAEQQSDWDKTLEKHKNDPKMTSRLKHLRSWKASEAEKAAQQGYYMGHAGRSHKFPGEDVDEGMSSYPTDANWDKSGQLDPLVAGTGPSRTRKNPKSTPKDLEQADWQTKRAIKNRLAKGSHKPVNLPEGVESADPVEGAVLNAAQELIHQGHTEVAPEVITNMVVAATGKPFMLKDLVDANKNSSAIQHYIDSINPSKVKFSSDILTVKNENPAKNKERAQSGVSNMAARAAGRNRLGS